MKKGIDFEIIDRLDGNGAVVKILNNNYTAQNIDIFLFEEKKQSLINVRLQYLKSTDWYTARELDEPNSYPQEIKAKRILARQEINEIEVATQKTINNYSITF